MKDRFGFDWSKIQGAPFWSRPQLGRRMFFRHVASAVSGYFMMPTRPMETIAKAHAISVRALHALFEDSGESVAALVRRERLRRCLEDLERPSGGSVTEIAFRWGFRDAAHFSRVFKRQFGATPSDARHAALARIGKESGAAGLAPGDALL